MKPTDKIALITGGSRGLFVILGSILHFFILLWVEFDQPGRRLGGLTHTAFEIPPSKVNKKC